MIVAYGDKVVMEPTLSDALVKHLRRRRGHRHDHDRGRRHHDDDGWHDHDHDAQQHDDHDPVPPRPPWAPARTLPSDPAALIALANSLYTQALTAQQAGDWAKYGQLIGELGKVLAALQAAQGMRVTE